MSVFLSSIFVSSPVKLIFFCILQEIEANEKRRCQLQDMIDEAIRNNGNKIYLSILSQYKLLVHTLMYHAQLLTEKLHFLLDLVFMSSMLAFLPLSSHACSFI